MTELVLSIEIAAPIGRCFDLARSIDFHVRSMEATRERVVGGVRSGLIGPRDEVEFEGVHLGLRRRLRTRITAMDPPLRFVDEQVRGPFRTFVHEHRFESLPGGCTRLTDRIALSISAWKLGVISEHLIIVPHLRRVLREHQRNLKRALEDEDGLRV